MVFGKYNFDINENDIILDDGKCIQLITRQEGYMWTKRIPVATIEYLEELKIKGEIYTNDELKKRAKKDYPNIENPIYWKFNIKKNDTIVILKSFAICNKECQGFKKGYNYNIKEIIENGVKVYNDNKKEVILEFRNNNFIYIINMPENIEFKIK